MSTKDRFPEELLLHEPNRGVRLVREFYEQYHDVPPIPDSCPQLGLQHEEIKAAFYQQWLQRKGHDERSLGLDVGCRGGIMIKLVRSIRWIGVDIDPAALEVARRSGISCAEMDFTSAIGFRDESFDLVMMTEVLEHLPYPSIILREVHRILKKKPASAYVGSVPLDYHLHRRWKVMRGKRLSGDQTHIHHFSFRELDRLLRFYFDEVHYLPLSGTAKRYPRLRLPYNLFVRDIAWAAASPKPAPGRWDAQSKNLK
jgi:SAM-dependent methyltransferase